MNIFPQKKSFLALYGLFTLSFIYSSIDLTNRRKTPMYLYAHGLFDTAAQARNYVNVLFNGPFISFDFPDATRNFWRLNFAKAALGQTKEIEHLATVIQDRYKRDPEFECIGVGVSRGAATWLNYMGIYKSDLVKALVLESPPDSMKNAVPDGLHSLLPVIFMEYDTKGIQPREVIKNIPKELPILLICIKNDHRVPYSSTVEVYRLLRESEHNNVHILVFESGSHGHFVKGANRSDYKNVANAFYKKYGLLYDKKSAKAGKTIFANTQPEPKELL